MEFIPDIALNEYSALRVGGTARGLYAVSSDEDVVKALDEIAKMGSRVYVIGAGMNTYFGDGKHDDLVLLRVGIKGISVQPSVIEGKVLTVGAGEDWDAVVDRAAAEGVWGIEALAGIPGTAGAAPIQNIGAYGTEAADSIEAVEVYDRKNKEIRGIPARLCGFGYRSSIFNGVERDRYIILRVRFWLHQKRRRALPKEVVEKSESAITPKEVGDQIRAIRKQKLPDYIAHPNCGSFFKNPVIEKIIAEKLHEQYKEMPQFQSGDGMKLSAAWLIEQAGLKGKTWGNVSVSSKHALVLETNGKASAAEVADAISAISGAVYNMFSVTLLPEPNFIP
ncbi:MAG TPA: UDP-N-acetylmuramate dehydrogenase [Candidatus Paceibacterota bacterium]|nr:UDP-N-acetylmuramate dehydrogenase [Candidatus Paceibacterota bacterium]